jgi:hypothetical protein
LFATRKPLKMNRKSYIKIRCAPNAQLPETACDFAE